MRVIIFEYLDDDMVKVTDFHDEDKSEVTIPTTDPQMKVYGELIYKEFEERKELCDFIVLSDKVFIHELRGV